MTFDPNRSDRFGVDWESVPSIADPAMRKMLIDRYRAAGIDIGENP